MSTTIVLPSQLYERLAQKSQQLNRTPEALVAGLVQQYLNETDNLTKPDTSPISFIAFAVAILFSLAHFS